MKLILLLPWFPILLGVGLGGRLLGRARGFALGTLGALFWIVLAQVSAGAELWVQPLAIAALLAGACTIIAMGGWAGETAESSNEGEVTGKPGSSRGENDSPDEDRTALVQLSAALDQFDDWLEVHRLDSDPWPRFDEFIRTMLYRCCHATHARPYRLLSDGRELAPLRGPDYTGETKCISAADGIIGQVVATGRAYVAGDPGHENAPHEHTDERGEPIAWCFAVSDGTRRLGVVTVGHLDVAPKRIGPLLGTAARLVEQFWRTLRETCRSRSAAITDPVSGLRTREPFLLAAEQSLAESFAQEEPVAVAVVALERLRELNDSGRWEVADEIVHEVGAILGQKIRMDDRLGRFDGSRFILLLRRVDSELALLIAGQIMSRLVTLCGDQSRWGTSIKVRCGVAGSRAERPDLRTLVARALQQCHRARQENARIASDLEVIPAGSNS